MLGKLLKSEFEQTYKPMVLMYLITAGIALITCITSYSVPSDYQLNTFGKIITTILDLSFFLSLGAVVFVCFLVSCFNFFKSMYSERGYLTHTIPVKTTTTFTVKFIVAIIWVAAAFLVTIICITAAGCVNGHINPYDLWVELSRDWKYLIEFERIGDFILFRPTLGGTIAEFFFLIIFGIAHSLLFIFTALTIGQLSNNHKIGCAIGAGVGLYFIGQVFGSILTVSKILPLTTNHLDTLTPMNDINTVMIILFVFLLLFMVLEYVVNMFIVKKHINLQ